MIQLTKTIVTVFTIMFGLTLINSVKAQDGEALFNAKCGACHILGSDGTGPNLQGVISRWEGEEEYLYEWVLNSPKVIGEGKSQRAQAVKDYSPTVMPVQNVTVDEAKAIIEFADAWTPPVKDVAEDGSGETAVIAVVPDYKKNLKIFYGLLLVIVALSIAVLIISKSTSALIKSDLFRQKVAEQHNSSKNGGLKALLLVVGFTFLSGTASALSFDPPAMAEDINVWVYIESTDIYILLTIALLLLGFLLHMINMFFKVLRIIKPKQKTIHEETTQSSFTRVLTGAVPIEEEDKIDLGHDYDGIRELDNPMPPWWLAGFFVSIVFAVIYMFHYHILGTGDLQEAAYEKNMAEAQQEIMEYRKKMAMNVDETNVTLMVDNNELNKGKALFINNCVVCHTETGQGDIGPNLTDDYWLYGGDIKDVFKVIKYGAPNGMPSHEAKMNPIQLQQISSYVLSLDPVSQADGGKEPQGDFYGEKEISEVAEMDSTSVSNDTLN